MSLRLWSLHSYMFISVQSGWWPWWEAAVASTRLLPLGVLHRQPRAWLLLTDTPGLAQVPALPSDSELCIQLRETVC